MTEAGRPVLGVTMGDPAGVGPEIVLALAAALAEGGRGAPAGLAEIAGRCSVVVIGDRGVLDERAALLGRTNPCVPVEGPGQIRSGAASEPLLLDLANVEPGSVRPGRVSAATGRAAVEYVLRAVELAKAGTIQAVVTAPIHKEAAHRAGYEIPGHTELLARETGTRVYAMMLVGGGLRVVLVTTHLPLAEVAGRLTSEAVEEKIVLAARGLGELGVRGGRIAVAGLNPHAGEGGILGSEEERIIAPAVRRARERGLDVEGPLPPDSLFHHAYRGRYQVVVCMYHDQGLIPLKMLALHTGVNITLGLPFVRTSVDHGTALDLAGTGRADPASLVQAVRTALVMVENRICE